MAENKLSFLENTFSDYEIEFTDNFTHAKILNPLRGDSITLTYYADDEYTPYCVSFSYLHCHLCDEEEVVEWIQEIIQGKLFDIEFFHGERHCFGGDISAVRLEDLTYAELEQYSDYYGTTKQMPIPDSFKVRGWNGLENFDAEYIHEEDGSIGIKRTYIR